MMKSCFEESFEIYLFTNIQKEDHSSKLNEFLSFLKYKVGNHSYKFSYVSRGDGLIPELTLNENILMNFSPNSLTEGREFQFQEFLKEQPNRSLKRLYQKIGLPHELPLHTDAQMKKVCSLMKSLIFEGQFIFLEEPEIDLDDECLALFISSLKNHMKLHKQNVFIFSEDLELWMPHVHQHVKREKDFSFSTEKVIVKTPFSNIQKKSAA
jgi:ABC-type lipoprotein export system ATPase subunit